MDSPSLVEFRKLAQVILRNRFIPEPPPDRNFVSGDRKKPIVEQGVGLLGRLVAHGLEPGHHLLDVGCGIGRLSLAATQYLEENARYFGLDINLSGIAWCHENITRRYPNFEFAVINAANPHYGHPSEYGQEPATRALWPIPAGRTFDYACAFSLFTHLIWDETAHYLGEVARRLKPGGRFFTTWYLINDETASGVRKGSALLTFNLDAAGPTHFAGADHLNAIAQDESAVVDEAARHELKLIHRRLSGWHTGAEGQDNLVFERV
jgi:SAM-dependent methyltransferase